MPNSTVEHVSFSDGQINLRLNNGNEVRNVLSPLPPPPPHAEGDSHRKRSGMIFGYVHKSQILVTLFLTNTTLYVSFKVALTIIKTQILSCVF